PVGQPAPQPPRAAGGVIGAVGLLILAVWAILPRWRSVIPHVLHGPVLAVRRLPGLRQLRRAMGGYELWRSVHRLTGLFVAAGFAHGLLDGTPFGHAQVLRWSFVAIGGTGGERGKGGAHPGSTATAGPVCFPAPGPDP